MSVYLHGIDVLVGAHVAPLDAEMEVVAQNVIAEIETPRLERVLASQIPGVPDEAWTEFALAMKTAAPGSISSSNAFGMFEMKPRRLADLGLMRNIVSARSSSGRMAWKGDWTPPLTEKKFLASAADQYEAFGASMRKYIEGLEDGSVPQPESGVPADVTLSGALAILHRCGPQGLVRWTDEGSRFPETIALVQVANGIF